MTLIEIMRRPAERRERLRRKRAESKWQTIFDHQRALAMLSAAQQGR